jgi:hypothetical protein
MQTTLMSFPNNGASSSTISLTSSSISSALSRSVPHSEDLFPDLGEVERECEARVPRTTIGGVSEVSEISMSLSDPILGCCTVCRPSGVDTLVLPLEIDGVWLAACPIGKEGSTDVFELPFSSCGRTPRVTVPGLLDATTADCADIVEWSGAEEGLVATAVDAVVVGAGVVISVSLLLGADITPTAVWVESLLRTGDSLPKEVTIVAPDTISLFEGPRLSTGSSAAFRWSIVCSS